MFLFFTFFVESGWQVQEALNTTRSALRKWEARGSASGQEQGDVHSDWVVIVTTGGSNASSPEAVPRKLYGASVFLKHVI